MPRRWGIITVMRGQVRTRRPVRGGAGSAQATIEFALVLLLLIACLLGSIGAAMWSVTRMGGVTAAENSVRLAVGAAGTGASQGGTANIGAATSPQVLAQMESWMPGTKAVAWPSGQPCPTTVAQVMSGRNGPTVAICASVNNSNLVHVRVLGCVSVLVPTFTAFTSCSEGVPIDVIATGQALVFVT